jgi:hypothetical protein
MHKLLSGIIFAAALVTSGSALAAEQTIIGNKLLIVNPASGPANNKVIFLSKDPSIVLPVTYPIEASLTVRSVLQDFTIELLHFNHWRINAAGTFKYRDNSGATCKVVVLKTARLIKAVCKGPQVDYDLGADQVSIDVVLDFPSYRRWCTTFNATTAGCTVVRNGSDGRQYFAKNCTTAPAVCASPSGAFIDGGAGLF